MATVKVSRESDRTIDGDFFPPLPPSFFFLGPTLAVSSARACFLLSPLSPLALVLARLARSVRSPKARRPEWAARTRPATPFRSLPTGEGEAGVIRESKQGKDFAVAEIYS